MDIVSGNRLSLPMGLYADLSVYRHDVFVGLLGWDLDKPDGLEYDQFDRPDTVYVVVRNEDGCINGCARLLPTTKPYLLGDVFPQLLNGLSPPDSEDVWELSRFAAVDLSDASRPPQGQMSSPCTRALLSGVIKTAFRLGARRLISVSPLGVERLLRHYGFRAHRAGPPITVGGHPLFACWIEIDVSLCD